MRQSPLLAFVVFVLVLASHAGAQEEKSLTSYLFVRSGDYSSDQYDYREAVTFYADGLIRSTKITWFERQKRLPHPDGNYGVVREGNTIREESLDKTGTPRSDSYEVRSDDVVVRVSRSQTTSTFIIRKRQDVPQGITVYERVENGIIVHEYTFTADRLVIRDLPIKRTLTCSLDPKTGLPVMTSTYERGIGSDITFGRTKLGDIFAIYRDADGPLLASYRFEGKPFHASPLITVINCEIGLDWLHGVLLPFIGGAPAQ